MLTLANRFRSAFNLDVKPDDSQRSGGFSMMYTKSEHARDIAKK